MDYEIIIMQSGKQDSVDGFSKDELDELFKEHDITPKAVYIAGAYHRGWESDGTHGMVVDVNDNAHYISSGYGRPSIHNDVSDLIESFKEYTETVEDTETIYNKVMATKQKMIDSMSFDELKKHLLENGDDLRFVKKHQHGKTKMEELYCYLMDDRSGDYGEIKSVNFMQHVDASFYDRESNCVKAINAHSSSIEYMHVTSPWYENLAETAVKDRNHNISYVNPLANNYDELCAYVVGESPYNFKDIKGKPSNYDELKTIFTEHHKNAWQSFVK